MIFLPIQSVASLRITVTSTATNLYSLMDTAGSLPLNGSQKYYSDLGANAIIISPENGDIRWLVGGTPTALIGTQISQGSTLPIAGIDLSQIKLIATGGSVTCNVQLYKSEPGEGLALGSGGGSALSYDAVTDADKVQVINQLPRQTILLQRDVTSTSVAFDEYIDVEGLKTVGIQATITSGTVTITLEATMENNGTAPASCDYVDITQYGTTRTNAAAAATLTTGKGAYLINNPGYKYVKIKVASPTSFVGSLYANAIN